MNTFCIYLVVIGLWRSQDIYVNIQKIFFYINIQYIIFGKKHMFFLGLMMINDKKGFIRFRVTI